MDSPAALLRRHGLRAKKEWGQCFLHDRGVATRIVQASGITRDQTVVEIGAGLGILTEALAAQAARVVAVERDRDLARVLREQLGQHPNVEILETNALDLELTRWGHQVPVVGNVPYNISTPLLFHLLDQVENISSVTLMLQHEVARRLAAGPGSRARGAPSVLCQRVTRVRICFVVSRGAFFPRPRVDSAVVRLDRLPHPRVQVPPALFGQVVHAAFQHRRKTLRQALARVFSMQQVVQALDRSGLQGSRRGETLSIEEFGQLAEALGAFGQVSK